MENFDIKNKDQSGITKELKNDFKNFEDRKKGYDEELHDLGIKHLENYRKKINAAITKIGNIPTIDKQKHSAKCTELTNRLNAAKEEINNKTLKLNLGWMAYKFHHDEHLNAIGSAIDRYEDDAIDTIKNLIEDINDDEQIQAEKGNVDNANKQRTYVEIDDNGIYRLTKHTNRPRIHEVLGGVINEGELWKIDYSSCTNQYIKNKMASAISSSENYTNTGESYSCYLQYDKNQNTYVLSDGDGHVLQQRALIREGVQLTPPSKIKGEAKLAKREREQAQIDKVNNIELSDKDQAELLESMPEKMRNRLRQQDVNEFFRVTEESLNERIIEAKQEGYILQSDPISKYDKNGYLMKLNLINGDSETSKPLIKNNFSSDVRKAFSKGQLKKYLTARVLKKWNDFDYLTKRGSVIDQTVDRGSDFINANQKAFSLKGLSMIGNWADAVFDKIGNTHLKDDDREFAALKIFVENAKNDLNSQNITSKDITTIEAKLAEMLKKFFNNNFFRSSMQINENDIDGYIKDIISSGNEEKQIVAMRRMGASRTWFDNSQTAFLRDDIFDMHTRKKKQKVKTDEDGNPIYETDESGNSVPIYETDENGNPIYETDENGNFINEDTIDLQDDNFEHYFERINELYQVNPDTDVDENGEIKEPKKTYIDNLYTAATTNSGKHGVKNFKQRLVDQGLLPNWRGHGGQIDDKVRALKSQLEQQEKNSKKFEITGSEIKERTMQKLADLKLTLTSSQIQAAEQGDTGRDDQGIATLNALNFMLQQDDSFFQDLATKETKDTQKSIKYCGVDGVVRGNLAPYLIRRGGGLNSDSEIAQIYNDSVGASGWFDFSDEGAEKVGPILKDIIVEVVVTAVSILLSRNGAGEAIYIAFREAKLAVQAMKGFRKFIQFMKIFAKKLLKQALAQGLGKLRVGATKLGARTVGGAKAAADVVRAAETLGTWGKIAVKGTSLLIEGTTFHINSTIIHNIINGEDFWEGLDPLGYTEGPDGEKIPNRQSYAQSIAFLGILKGTGKVMGKLTGKSLQSLTGKEIQNIAKGRYGPAMVNKIFSTSLSLGSEMSSMMLTDQVLSLTFDQSLKPITGEELISMFGMIVGLRLNGKFQMKVKEYAGRKTTIRMAQEGTGNIFDVHIDREGNVLKVEGTDKNGKKIQNPQDVLGIKSGVEGQNLRQTHEGREVGTVKGDIKQLNNLHEGDVITVKHGENDIKFKKNKSGNREIVDSGNITNERFNTGEEFVVKKNADGSGFHLESKFEGGPKITLDGKVRVKLGDRSSTIVDGNNGITAQRSEDNNRVSENVENNNNPIEDILKNKVVEDLYDKFDREIMSKDGITIDGITYKLERRPNEGHNPNRKGRVVYTEIGPDGKVIYKAEAHSNTFVLPENSNGNNIRNRFNAAREKYVNKNLNSALEPARQGLDSEVSKDIDSRTKDLEGKRKDKETLELNKKSLSDEIDGLKSRKAQLEQQLQNISKELAQQTDIVSLNDIYSIIKPTHKISIGGKKMTFVGVKGNKIVFTEGKGKTREFSSFKELQDAGANFNIDIKSRQGEKGLEQQILFEELVSKEARTSSANEIIKKYEELQRQKVQIENDIRDGYFRENAAKLKGKHIWIDGVEYQCTDIKTNNGRTTLDFKKTDGNEHFTISSFEQLKAKGQVNGFGDRYNVRDKESRAAGRELSQYERENYDLLRGENGLFKGENKYVENKRQELQQINQQLENGKNDYNNAVQTNRPRTVTNPEYERILKEIEGIDAQLVEKGQELVGIERDLGASNTEITRLEQEIRELTELRDNLSRIEYKNDIIDNNKQREELEMKVNDIKRFGKYNYEFKDIVENNLDRIINLEKIENIDSFMNESFEFLKKGMGIDDPGLKIKILEGTEGIDNHYDRSTNTVYFSRNFGGERQMYVKGGNKAEIFGGIGHELNHYLQETEIIKHYGKGNRDIDLFVDAILETANTEGLEMIERYRTQINHNEPISERAIRYAESYVKAGEDGTIFDHNGNILDYNKYRQLEYEKESFDKGDILAEEYRKATKSYKGEQQTFNQKGISTKEIQSRLDSDLIKLSNNQAFSDIKLDRATQETFKSGSFAQGIKNWIKEHINTPYFSVPKEYIKNIRYKLAENVTFWQNQLKLYFHEKLLPKYKSIKTRIGKKMENIDWEEVKNALDDLSDGLDNLKDLKDEINKHENSDNIETISTDVDGIIQIRENIIERFPDIEHIDGEHMDGGDMQIGHGENFIDPYQEDIGFDLYSYPIYEMSLA